MINVENLVGLDWGGNFFEGDNLLLSESLIAIATSKKALGVELNTFCIYFEYDVPNDSGDDELLNVVIGDPYILTDVKVIAKGELDEIEMPEEVYELLFYANHRLIDEFIVFENKDGSRVYVRAHFTTLLKNVIHKIDPQLLPEHLKDV